MHLRRAFGGFLLAACLSQAQGFDYELHTLPRRNYADLAFGGYCLGHTLTNVLLSLSAEKRQELFGEDFGAFYSRDCQNDVEAADEILRSFTLFQHFIVADQSKSLEDKFGPDLTQAVENVYERLMKGSDPGILMRLQYRDEITGGSQHGRHVVLLTGARKEGTRLIFTYADPNSPQKKMRFIYNRVDARALFPDDTIAGEREIRLVNFRDPMEALTAYRAYLDELKTQGGSAYANAVLAYARLPGASAWDRCDYRDCDFAQDPERFEEWADSIEGHFARPAPGAGWQQTAVVALALEQHLERSHTSFSGFWARLEARFPAGSQPLPFRAVDSSLGAQLMHRAFSIVVETASMFSEAKLTNAKMQNSYRPDKWQEGRWLSVEFLPALLRRRPDLILGTAGVSDRLAAWAFRRLERYGLAGAEKDWLTLVPAEGWIAFLRTPSLYRDPAQQKLAEQILDELLNFQNHVLAEWRRALDDVKYGRRPRFRWQAQNLAMLDTQQIRDWCSADDKVPNRIFARICEWNEKWQHALDDFRDEKAFSRALDFYLGKASDCEFLFEEPSLAGSGGRSLEAARR